MAYGDFKDLPRRIASNKALRDKAFIIAKNPKYDGYQRGLVSMVYKRKHLLPCHYTINDLKDIGYLKLIIEMEINDELKEINVKNRTCYYFNGIIKRS